MRGDLEKPRLRRLLGRVWHCEGTDGVARIGDTPCDAYARWASVTRWLPENVGKSMQAAENQRINQC